MESTSSAVASPTFPSGECKTASARPPGHSTVSKDGQYVAAGTHWWGVMVYDANTCRFLFTSAPPPSDLDRVVSLDLSPDPTQLLVTMVEHSAAVWDRSCSHAVGHVDHPSLGVIHYPQDVPSIAIFSPDDRFLALCGKEGKILSRSYPEMNASITFRLSCPIQNVSAAKTLIQLLGSHLQARTRVAFDLGILWRQFTGLHS